MIRKIEVTASVATALRITQYLLDNVPSWAEFKEYDLLLGGIEDDAADGPCGFDNLHYFEREVYINLGHSGATFASIHLFDGGGGWYADQVTYYEIAEAGVDQGIKMRGQNGWTDKCLGARKELPQMVIDHLKERCQAA